ncbi:MAG: hypothetical protein IJT66_03955 [Clostridia bacterium]|nr:hypothetical protein [Clostridia bacterium]
MKFSKYNNPSRRRRRKPQAHSREYIEERERELMALLATAKTDQDKQILIDAFNISINP